jgi:hypothetical protein
MSQEPGLELPEHVVTKIQQVLGIPSAQVGEHGLVKLIEDLCDTALMFDREERVAAEANDQEVPPQRLPSLPPSPENSQ